MLRVSLLGNCGADAEVRYSAKGTQIVSLRVAVNQVRTTQDGERQENTEWFRVRVTGRQAEFAQRLGKGSRVLVFGRLDISHYQSKDGEARTGFDVWADDIQSMSRREEQQESPDGEAAPAPVAAAPAARPTAPADPAPDETPDLEDLPFLMPRHIQEPWLRWKCP